MTQGNRHPGSTFDSWLDEQGLRREVTTAAVKAVLAAQLKAAMKEQELTRTAMAERMQTGRAELNRLLDPAHHSVTLETPQRAAKVTGRKIRLELV